jgi:hypothetical protein
MRQLPKQKSESTAESQSWEDFIDDEMSKENVAKIGEPDPINNAHPLKVAHVLSELIGSLDEKTFTDALYDLEVFYDLIRLNTHFQKEAEAMRMILHGENILTNFCTKVSAQ